MSSKRQSTQRSAARSILMAAWPMARTEWRTTVISTYQPISVDGNEIPSRK